MPIGAAARHVLGPAFPIAGAAYRRTFLNIREVARCVPDLAPGSTLLDIGSGDGAILNHILDRQPTLQIVSVDLSAETGGLLQPDLAERVRFFPGTSVRQFVDAGGGPVDAAFLSDVLHHVRPDARADLLRDTLDAFGHRPPMLIVKEVVPRGLRARAAFWADRNISGDRGVSPIGPVQLTDLISAVDPALVPRTTPLLEVDYPNYCLVFTRGWAGTYRSRFGPVLGPGQ